MKLAKALLLAGLIWTCGCTTPSDTSRQDSQTRKAGDRPGYDQVNKYWRAQLEDRCGRHWQQGDDPIYPGTLPDHEMVSIAYMASVQKGCADILERLKKPQ